MPDVMMYGAIPTSLLGMEKMSDEAAKEALRRLERHEAGTAVSNPKFIGLCKNGRWFAVILTKPAQLIEAASREALIAKATKASAAYVPGRRD